MFLPAAVSNSTMAGAGKRAEVAEPGLAGRPAVIHRHIPFGVIYVHVWAETGAEREHVGDLSDSDPSPQLRRYLISVDRGYLGGIQQRLDPHLTSAAAQKLD